jgi:hypothetical protein
MDEEVVSEFCDLRQAQHCLDARCRQCVLFEEEKDKEKLKVRR